MRAADGSGVADRVVADRAVAHGVGAQAGQRPAGGAGRLGSLLDADEAEGAVDDGGSELAEADLTERRLDIEPGRGLRSEETAGLAQRVRPPVALPAGFLILVRLGQIHPSLSLRKTSACDTAGFLDQAFGIECP